MRQAEQGIAALSGKVDSLIVIPNDRLKYVTDQKITFANAFGIADDVLKMAVTSISALVGFSERVIINLDFADVSAVMKDAGRAHMGVGVASGREKAEQAAMAPGRRGDCCRHRAGGCEPRCKHHLRCYLYR